MAYNKLGLQIDRKCNDCKTETSFHWYLDKEKGIGWKCTNCYALWRNARIRAQRKRTEESIVVENKEIVETFDSSRVSLSTVMEKVLKYLIETETSADEFHTVSSISLGIKCNYNTVHKAVKMLNVMHTHFFSQYDLNVKRLKTTSNSNRDKLEVITTIRRNK